ncbi:hypothetical protein SapgrDRAFT_1257 [Saprospira grandis DSM 2844]|uniref:Uncharacterized protein n=1 Tax=Saprospira grandis DSM 2844 TaxID=694433 RepID=J1I2P7_9BACT|nr:hypothetical protein [Saprospira grandis]EJF52980.1 hypothetical protein SapgrDRAFT_1257 [Saprospira grandis DSM 2844]
MKKQLLFAGAFCLGLGAFGLLSSFDDGEQAKIDAKYEELKTKFMEEQMQKCQETADEEAMRLYKEENGEATPEEEPTKSGTTAGGSTRPVAPNSGSATSGSEGSSTTPAEEATSGGATKDPQKGRGGATTKGDANAQKQRGGATTTNDASSQKRRPGAN